MTPLCMLMWTCHLTYIPFSLIGIHHVYIYGDERWVGLKTKQNVDILALT